MLKAVLFDMDGVLVDSELQHSRAAVIALEKIGVKINIEYMDKFIGSTNSILLNTVKKEFGLSLSLEELHSLYTQTLEELVLKEGHTPISYTKELIIELHEKGIKLAIASSSSLDSIKEITTALGIHGYFDKLVSGAFIKNPKPAPDIYLLAAKELGVSPTECIVIEDSYHGVTSGKAANIPVIGFINKNSGNQNLSQADMLIEGFEEINYDFLNQIYQRANNLPITIATTTNLTIKELAIEDIPHMYKIMQHPEIRKFVYDFDSSLNDEIKKHRSYIAHIYHFYGFGLWGVYHNKTNRLIGRCGIQSVVIHGKDEIELGYLIEPSYQKQGFGYESVKAIINYAQFNLSINRLVARIVPDNIASLTLAKRIGMTFEKEIENNDQVYLLFSIDIKNSKE